MAENTITIPADLWGAATTTGGPRAFASYVRCGTIDLQAWNRIADLLTNLADAIDEQLPRDPEWGEKVNAQIAGDFHRQDFLCAHAAGARSTWVGSTGHLFADHELISPTPVKA